MLGRFIYTFDMRVPGKSAISDVNVDAGDRQVLSTRRPRGREEDGNFALQADRVTYAFE